MTPCYIESLICGPGGLMLAMIMSSYALPMSFSFQTPYLTIIPVKTCLVISNFFVIGILPYPRIKFPLDDACKSLHLPCSETAEEYLLRPRGQNIFYKSTVLPRRFSEGSLIDSAHFTLFNLTIIIFVGRLLLHERRPIC